MTKDEALHMALEYLEESDNYLGSLDHSEPIAAIKEALAQPEPEPKFWEMPDGKIVDKWALQFYREDIGTPLYTQPNKWQDLTDDEIDKTYETQVWDAKRSYARAIEAKLKQKNGYAEEKNT